MRWRRLLPNFLRDDVSLGQGSEEDAWQAPEDFDAEEWQRQLRELGEPDDDG